MAALALASVACGGEDDDDGPLRAMDIPDEQLGGNRAAGGGMSAGGQMAPGGGQMAPAGGEMAPGGGAMVEGGAMGAGGEMAEGGAMAVGGTMEPGAGGAQMPMGGADMMPTPEACGVPAEEGHFYAFSANSFTRQGAEVPMCEFENRVLLVVNTAANCGLTPQYEWLQQMDDSYRMQGLTVLGFLSNDFSNQGGTDDEVAECEMDYGVKFEQFSMVGVRPDSAQGQHPIFAWLTNQPGMEGAVPWNFSKFLISHDGRLLARWSGGEHRVNSGAAEEAILAALEGLE